MVLDTSFVSFIALSARSALAEWSTVADITSVMCNEQRMCGGFKSRRLRNLLFSSVRARDNTNGYDTVVPLDISTSSSVWREGRVQEITVTKSTRLHGP